MASFFLSTGKGQRVRCPCKHGNLTANCPLVRGIAPKTPYMEKSVDNLKAMMFSFALHKCVIVAQKRILPSVLFLLHLSWFLYAQCPPSWYLIRFPSATKLASIRFAVAADTPHNSRTSAFIM